MVPVAFERGHLTRDKGFSLLEVMVAISILTIGILAVASMQITAVRGNASAENLTEASALVGGRIERLIALPYDDPLLQDTDGDGFAGLQDATSETSDHSTPDGEKYTVYWNIAADDVAGGTKTISVIVTWPDRMTEGRLSVQHVIPRL